MWRGVLILFVIIGFMFTLDIYFNQIVKHWSKEKKWVSKAYWLITILGYLYVLFAFTSYDPASTPRKVINTFMGFFMVVYIPKMVAVTPLLFEDLVRFFTLLALKILPPKAAEGPLMPSRRKFVSQMALGLAAIPFSSIIYGMWKGKYDFRVINKELSFPNLPDAFDGFRILQISDIHSGSFDNAEKVEYGISLINQQKADLVAFTGDLVNNMASEMDPWIDTFKAIQAPFGKYSILGNHDYGDYMTWPSEEAKEENIQQLYSVHEKIGFDLLRNEHRVIERNGEKIVLAGVENWGKGFHQHGDLNKSIQGIPADAFTVMMSHDPSHFDEQIKQNTHPIPLTLSGHTHGMQFGIEIPGFVKWSPVKYRYPKWAGLYEDLGKYLYVNRGFGYLAFPGRVGIWPEITVLTLRKGTA